MFLAVVNLQASFVFKLFFPTDTPAQIIICSNLLDALNYEKPKGTSKAPHYEHEQSQYFELRWMVGF